ncbi:MAG: hypothetical protein J0L92_37190 [Deltaproteobacteria bacterium]|nr:hypothetical protein [Deltaproteobacteria bacterium]
MKDDYTRTTRRVSVAAIVTPLREASARAARVVDVEDLDVQASLLIETHSVKSRAAGFFARVLGGDGDREHWTVLAVTPRAVIVGTHGETRGTWVRALPTDTLELEAVPAIGGEMTARTLLLASPVLASLGPSGEPTRVGSYPLVLATAADADDAKRAIESAIASRRS